MMNIESIESIKAEILNHPHELMLVALLDPRPLSGRELIDDYSRKLALMEEGADLSDADYVAARLSRWRAVVG